MRRHVLYCCTIYDYDNGCFAYTGEFSRRENLFYVSNNMKGDDFFFYTFSFGPGLFKKMYTNGDNKASRHLSNTNK